jgi:hypothetical protein
MTQQGRNMQECVTIDDKTLFVHLLVISVFVHIWILKLQTEDRKTKRSQGSGGRCFPNLIFSLFQHEI